MGYAPLITPVDDNGIPLAGSRTAAVPAGAATTVIKKGVGRIAQVLVTADAASAGSTIYDNTAGSGTVLAVIPATATAGTVFKVDMPALIGITVVGIAGSPPLTVSYAL